MTNEEKRIADFVKICMDAPKENFKVYRYMTSIREVTYNDIIMRLVEEPGNCILTCIIGTKKMENPLTDAEHADLKLVWMKFADVKYAIRIMLLKQGEEPQIDPYEFKFLAPSPVFGEFRFCNDLKDAKRFDTLILAQLALDLLAYGSSDKCIVEVGVGNN